MAENVHIARVKFLWNNYGCILLFFAYLVYLFICGYNYIRQSYEKKAIKKDSVTGFQKVFATRS